MMDSKSPTKIGAGHGYGGMLLQVEEVYNVIKSRWKVKFMGAYNDRNVRGGSSKSMHAYGRAFDVGSDPKSMQEIADFCRTIPGVQYVIYNKRISGPGENKPWRAYNPGPGGSMHIDHVHVDFQADFKGLSGISFPTIREGSQGGFVKFLQGLIGGISIDGLFGGKTKDAVKDFQEHNKLREDGIVGKNTWGKLTQGKGLFF